MKLTFIRADHEVTGSCTLLEIGGHYGLIDCGMEQGRDLFENIAIPVPAAQIEFVLVTHAHMDHTGHLPLLYKQGFRGTVYATEATCDLCGIMLRDAAHIQMSEAEWKGRKAARAGQPAPEPLYTLEDVEGVLRLLRPCGYGKRIQVGENIIIRFTDVGHLLGSACIEAWLTEGGTEKKIVFSGDIGNTDQPIIRDPQTVSGADYVLIESTYGDRSHGPRVDYLTALADCIQRTLDRGGNVVIPSFAVGRTQELLYFIRQIKDAGMVHGHPHFPVYVDSPLANEATRVFLQTDTSFLDDEACALIRSGINPLYFDDLHTAVTKEDSMALNTDKTPKVILSSSGMCDAGRIRHHLKYNLWRPECTVLFVGYQAVGTLGRKLHDGAESVKIFGDEIAVHAEITVLPGVSGHADKQGLLGWINAMEQKPAHVFVNHGDDDACTAFAACLRSEYGYDADAPYSGTEKTVMKLGVHVLPKFTRDTTDRNRTSPFAFTGNRFEFRAAGSSSNCAASMIAINAAMANQLNEFRASVEKLMEEGVGKDEAIFRLLKETIIASEPIRFEGDGYSEEWKQEAARRGLTNICHVPEALMHYIDNQSKSVLIGERIFNETELNSRLEVELEKYTMKVQIEGRVLGDLAINHIVPTAVAYQNRLLENLRGLKEIFPAEEYEVLSADRKELIREISHRVTSIKVLVRDMTEARKVANHMENYKERAFAYEEKVRPYLDQIRDHIDHLEMEVDDEIWPLPKYRELLFTK